MKRGLPPATAAVLPSTHLPGDAERVREIAEGLSKDLTVRPLDLLPGHPGLISEVQWHDSFSVLLAVSCTGCGCHSNWYLVQTGDPEDRERFEAAGAALVKNFGSTCEGARAYVLAQGVMST